MSSSTHAPQIRTTNHGWVTTMNRRFSQQPLRRAALGFVFGFVVAAPAAMLAVAHPVVELLKPYLLPGALLLGSFHDFRTSPALVSVLLGSVANALLFAVVGALTAWRFWPRRRGTSGDRPG
jgi:hypothetical protein